MNITIQEMTSAMLYESGTSRIFWGEGTHTMVNILNQAYIHVNSYKMSYELWYGKRPTVKHYKFFGSSCYINNNNDKHGKFEA